MYWSISNSLKYDSALNIIQICKSGCHVWSFWSPDWTWCTNNLYIKILGITTEDPKFCPYICPAGGSEIISSELLLNYLDFVSTAPFHIIIECDFVSVNKCTIYSIQGSFIFWITWWKTLKSFRILGCCMSGHSKDPMSISSLFWVWKFSM